MLLLAPQNVSAAFKAKGIDVSRWQGTIDWEKVKADGIEFVMVGVGRYKSNYVDVQLKNNLENANKYGIHVGVYLYSEAVTEEEAREEADFVLDQIEGYKISYPIAFDIEDTVHLALSTKKRTDIAIAFLEVIEEAGYHPMIYASENWFNTKMDLTRLTKYDKWVARWADSVSFSPYTMWQYSATGTVKGISGDVDLDYCYVDYSKLITPRTKAVKRRSESTWGWKTDGTHYWYIREDGTQPKACLETIDGKTYFFNKNGYRFSGWKKIDGQYFYFRKNGVMKTGGWLKIKTKKYYLNPENGARMTGWQTINNKQYYFSKKGVLQTGWKKLKGKYYYFDSDGVMQKGLITVDGNQYYLSKKTGRRLTGWRKLSGKWYYFGPKTGAMQKNCYVGRYKLEANGVCLNRTVSVSSSAATTGSTTTGSTVSADNTTAGSTSSADSTSADSTASADNTASVNDTISVI